MEICPQLLPKSFSSWINHEIHAVAADGVWTPGDDNTRPCVHYHKVPLLVSGWLVYNWLSPVPVQMMVRQICNFVNSPISP